MEERIAWLRDEDVVAWVRDGHQRDEESHVRSVGDDHIICCDVFEASAVMLRYSLSSWERSIRTCVGMVLWVQNRLADDCMSFFSHLQLCMAVSSGVTIHELKSGVFLRDHFRLGELATVVEEAA